MNELERLRARIDALDAKIVSLLNRRAVAVRAVGEFKRERGLPVLDASRERRIYERLRGLSKGPLRPDDVERMFRALIAEYRRFEAVAPAGPARNPASPRASVAIVGMGLIGGSLAKALRRSGKWRVIGLPGPRVRANRELRAAAHVLAADPAAALTADLVVLAAPLAAIERFIKEWGPRARPGSVWTDVGSAKESVLRAARAHLAPGAEFVGGHPMAGSARGGFGNSRPDLFNDAAWALCPLQRAAKPALRLVERLVRDAGARPIVLSAREHDRRTALTSHMPQLAASAVASVAAAGLAGGPSLAGPGLRDTTRLADSPADIWKDIAARNGANIRAALRALSRELSRAGTDVEGLFRRAHAARRRISGG